MWTFSPLAIRTTAGLSGILRRLGTKKFLQVSWFPIDSLYVPNFAGGAYDCRI